jgi:uncharacterized protein YkwD
MKLLAWGLVLVSTGVAAAQQPAAPSPSKTVNAKATHDGVGAGKDTQSQTKVQTVSAATSTPTKAGITEASLRESKKQAAPPTPLHQHPTMVTMLQRSNGIRGRAGLGGHRLNPALCQAAQNHAEYMASTGSFSHDTNGGYVYRARRFGFRGGVRENIGWNYANSEQAFGAWQGSGGHYSAIVSATTDAGFGYAKSPNGQTYWVSVYGAATAADIADAKAIFDKEKLAAEEAQAKLAEAAASSDDSKVVPASAETEVKPDKTAKVATPAPPVAQPAKISPPKQPTPITVGG